MTPAGAEDGEGPGGPAGCLAIVAGRGALPRELATLRAARGLPYLLIVFPDCLEPWMEDHPLQHHRFEKVGRLFAALSAAGVRHIVFAGAMDRPKLRPWQADRAAVCVALRAFALLRKGDDAMLRGFARIFEERGIGVIAPGEVLGARALVPPGPFGRHGPRAGDLDDMRRGREILAALGPLDIGQGVVVAGGLCLGIETLGGTDALLGAVAALPAAKRAVIPAPSGVLLKLPKAGQDTRVDLPAVGPDTVRGAAAAGLRGIAVAAERTHLLDGAALRAEADRLGLFLYGLREDEL